jgi:trimeric autotransporter adhesin
MRNATLTLTLATLLTGCVAASPPDSQAVTAPATPCDTTNHALATVALILTAPAQIVRGTSAGIVATAISSDGSRHDATPLVSWTSTSFLTASVTDGTLYGVGVGRATIQASLGEVNATADVEILPVSLQALTLDADAESAPAGAVIAWRVNGHYNDGSTVDLTATASWQTSDASIVTVDEPGQIHARSTGMAMITAAADGIEVSSPMMVTQ